MPLPPDSFRLLMALAGRRWLPRLPPVLEAARLHQGGVTTDLRRQAREAIVGFHQCSAGVEAGLDPAVLWHEGLCWSTACCSS